jgi:hypothetical protein
MFLAQDAGELEVHDTQEGIETFPQIIKFLSR